MSTTELIERIEKLPVDKQREVEDFVFELTTQVNTLNTDKKPRMKFGDLKGFVKYMSDDFDEPMDDFKDYM